VLRTSKQPLIKISTKSVHFNLQIFYCSHSDADLSRTGGGGCASATGTFFPRDPTHPNRNRYYYSTWAAHESTRLGRATAATTDGVRAARFHQSERYGTTYARSAASSALLAIATTRAAADLRPCGCRPHRTQVAPPRPPRPRPLPLRAGVLGRSPVHRRHARSRHESRPRPRPTPSASRRGAAQGPSRPLAIPSQEESSGRGRRSRNDTQRADF
jgi:hypothetical protein